MLCRCKLQVKGMWEGESCYADVSCRLRVRGKENHEDCFDTLDDLREGIARLLYNGETGRRLLERSNERSGKDVNSHILNIQFMLAIQ